MRTLILYATKYGATKQIAEDIAGLMGDSVLFDLKDARPPELDGFDRIIIGSSVYAGSIRKEAKAFLSKNAGALKDKTVGLFLSGMSGGEVEKVFTSNFPADVLAFSKARSFLGGIFDPKKAKTAERLIMKIAIKKSDYTSTVDNEKIKEFAAQVSA
jgi:menaquinone-dependent protoporphyrinogen oxidase